MPNRNSKLVIVALGGNSITAPGGDGSVAHDRETLESSLDAVLELLETGHRVVLTHGNGPQIGNMMVRNELAHGQTPDLPLPLMVADVQGGLGYMMQCVLRGKLDAAGLTAPVCTIVTLVEVDRGEASSSESTKFVGPILSEKTAQRRRESGWEVAEDRGRGWRRVVPSPQPRRILEAATVQKLAQSGAVVICCGGGGVPVIRDAEGSVVGVPGVIDKDAASALLGEQIGAHRLYILTSVDRVQTGFGTAEARPLSTLNVHEARSLLAEGEFPPGSMGPKIEAACAFLESGGEAVLITSQTRLSAALEGGGGTWIIPAP